MLKNQIKGFQNFPMSKNGLLYRINPTSDQAGLRTATTTVRFRLGNFFKTKPNQPDLPRLGIPHHFGI
jgi:hypothetical protein